MTEDNPTDWAALLIAFLEARLTEVEDAANACAVVYPPPWDLVDRGHTAYITADAPYFYRVAELDQDHALLLLSDMPKTMWLGDYLAHIALHNPTAVLADCAVKRKIIGQWQLTVNVDGYPIGGLGAEVQYDTLRALASVWAEHPEHPKLPEVSY